MKNFKCKWTLLSLAVTLLAFSSCKKDDDDKVDLTAKVDVYVMSKKIGDAIKYAPAYTVTANKKLKSVSVKTPGTTGKTISLTQGSTTSIFEKKPSTDSDYSSTMPTKGDYTFTIKSEDSSDEELTKTDALEDKKLTEELIITEAKYASSKETIKWDLVTDADKYILKLYNSEGKVLFSSDYLAKTIKEYSFGTSTEGWSSTKVEKGNNYKIELCAIKLETEKTTTDDFQFMEFAEKTIKWEE